MYSSAAWSSNIERLLLGPIYQLGFKTDEHTQECNEGPSASRPPGYLARTSRHPPGTIWRKFVAKCVLSDLFSGALGARCRIARMYELGLGAIVMYETPQLNWRDSDGVGMENWTVESVFGGPRGFLEERMTEEELLDGIQVKVVYTPSYACTSFVTGQVMNALLQSFSKTTKDIRPIPAAGGLGFAVDAGSFTPFDHGLSRSSLILLEVSKILRPVSSSECAPRYLTDRDAWSQVDSKDSDDSDATEMAWVEVHPLSSEFDEDKSPHCPFGTINQDVERRSMHFQIAFPHNAFSFASSNSSEYLGPSLSTSNSIDIATSLASFQSTSEHPLFALEPMGCSASLETDIGEVSMCTLVSDVGSSSSQSSLFFGPLTPAKGPRHRPDPVEVPPLIRFDDKIPISDRFPLSRRMGTSHVDCGPLSDDSVLFDVPQKDQIFWDAVQSKVEADGKAVREYCFGIGKENIPPCLARV
ncbi:hypothetical protein V5O48_004161 [Marasmius crinis-equi]|uniref:Uncharacterized protein n=1 Tax=Marasmius crinis-equi TaxID=585013 RepID=A0ABR3FR46_9AGAR